MNFATSLVAVLLSIFSTAMMTYISMATPIGPWVALTITLIAIPLLRRFVASCNLGEEVALAVSAGSIGGILATGVGFSFPTLYFLSGGTFGLWVSTPLFMFTALGGLVFVAGALGLWVAGISEKSLIVEQEMPFPIGQLVYKMIGASGSLQRSRELLHGLYATFSYCFLQNGLWRFKGFIPQNLKLIPGFSFLLFRLPTITLDMSILPMLWAIGFVTGHVIAMPLAAGAIANIFLLNPVHTMFFPKLSSAEFLLAFCSGMVVSGAVSGFIGTPIKMWKTIKNFGREGDGKVGTFLNSFLKNPIALIEFVVALAGLVIFFWYFQFPILSQIFIVVGTLLCTYQIIVIAGKIGLAQLGRFATYVMVPAMLLFGLDLVQIVLVATFVEVCGGVATDVMFGRKLAHMAGISSCKIRGYQYLGLLVSSLTIGLFFWLLVSKFELGSAQLFAQRSQARALLVQSVGFDVFVLALGFLFGFILKKIRMSPMMVLGGLLMPLNISIGLILGGMCTLFVSDRERWYPLWSGVFAANSVWMLIRSLV